MGMKKRAPQNKIVSRALALLDPLSTEPESCRKLVENMVGLFEVLTAEKNELEVGLHSTQGKTDLKRYVTALRKVKVCFAALNPSIQAFLAMDLSAIEHDIAEATAMSEATDLVQRRGGAPVKPRHPSGHPVNRSARVAVLLARSLLEQRGCELTTERKSKWHLLSQIFAGTSRDLRHHLTASLAENPRR
jgi:hypothetical protein